MCEAGECRMASVVASASRMPDLHFTLRVYVVSG